VQDTGRKEKTPSALSLEPDALSRMIYGQRTNFTMDNK
jgi:hypothetical protein